MIFTITGPSGSGKSTLASTLFERFESEHLLAEPLQSVTTRSARETDQYGEYTYVSDAAFADLIRENAFLWHKPVHSYRYGTRKVAIDQALESGTFVAVLVIEAVAQLHAYAAKSNKSDAVRSVYLHMDDIDELRQRLQGRGDTKDIEARLEECRDWNEKAHRAMFPLRILDAKKSKDEVLAQALEYFLP